MRFTQSSTLPLYSQIKEIIRSKVIDGTYQVHEKLPSESEMMYAFGVSRITVRQAVNDLQKEGLLFKVQGKGAFVAMPNASQELTHLQGFGEAMHQQGRETFSEVFQLKSAKGSAIICSKLGLKEGRRVTEIGRVRYLDREPISMNYAWTHFEIGSKLTCQSLRNKDLFSLLENELGQQLHSAEVEIESTSANVEVANRLNIERHSPILKIERLTYSKSLLPLVFEYHFYRADSFKYKLKVMR